MQIQKVTLFTPDYKLYQNKKNNAVPEEHKSEALRMFAYKDFNINFTGSDGSGRLFRTPANFYSTPFNRKGMPDTMKAYLNADYEDRQNMPPIQMWKTVFDDINMADNLEDVKILFPEEPLFANLKNNPNKARTSIISQIQTLQDDFKETPLFKDGKSDLGLYLLKKIYLEGKQIAEINKDFQKDINDEYRGLIDKKIDPATTAAYGIKFPNLAFWNSFVVTRDDFPYEYKPRKVSENKSVQQPRVKKERSLEDIRRDALEAERKQKFKPTDFEIRQLSDAVLDKKPEKALDKIRKRGGQNAESASFVEKYFSPIMSVALEKINASDEMRDFFQNPENMSKSSKDRMQKYWREHPHFRALQSMAIKDTIKLFFEAYGADGNNEVFQDLLKYADSIKPERQERLRRHNELQQEYERALGIFETEEKSEVPPINTAVADIDEEDGDIAKYQKLFEDLKKEYNVDSYDFVTSAGDKVSIISNLREALEEHIQDEMSFLPQAFTRNFINFVQKNPKVNDSYILTTLLRSKGIELPEDKRLMPLEDAETLTLELYQEYTDKYPDDVRAAQQAITDTFINFSKDEITPELFRLGVFEFVDLSHAMSSDSRKFLKDELKKTTEKYMAYKRPLSESEIRKAAITVIDLLRKYNPDNSIIKRNEHTFSGFDTVFGAISLLIKNKDMAKPKDDIKNNLSNYLKQYGGAARFFLDKSMPESLKTAKMEQLLCNYTYDKPGELLVYITLSPESLRYVKERNPELFNYFRNEMMINQYI